MENRLDRHFETLFLLLYPEWGDEQKKKVVDEIDALGIDGAAFYSTSFAPIVKYYAAFREHRIESPGTKLLDGIDEMALYVLIEAFRMNPEWLEAYEDVPDEAAHKTVETAVADLLDGEEDIIKALESDGFTDQARWQIMALLQQPKQRLSSIAQAISENIPAFEVAAAQVKTELDILLSDFDERSKDRIPTIPVRLSRAYDPHAEIKPTLAMPLAFLVMEGICFYGLLVDQLLFDKEIGFSKGEIIFGAKALSDASKVEILVALKEGSLYNLEIANKIGLTPATVSHHMNILLTAGFVDIEKRDGKAYYSLSRCDVEKFLEGVRDYLLR